MCYLFVVSYYKPLPPDKNPFAVNKYYITLHYKTGNIQFVRDLQLKLFAMSHAIRQSLLPQSHKPCTHS
jgi:hypothetical protein